MVDFEFACQDDCLEKMVPSDLRQLVAERDELKSRVTQLQTELLVVWELYKQNIIKLDELKWIINDGQ